MTLSNCVGHVIVPYLLTQNQTTKLQREVTSRQLRQNKKWPPGPVEEKTNPSLKDGYSGIPFKGKAGKCRYLESISDAICNDMKFRFNVSNCLLANFNLIIFKS